MILKRLYSEEISFLTEYEFESIYNHATLEPHNC
jgi:hypothetical protein